MSKGQSKMETARAMADRGLSRASAPPEADETVDLLLEHISRGIDKRTSAGKAQLALLRQVRERGISLRQLQAWEVSRMFELEKQFRDEKIEAGKMHVQVAKIIESLRKLAEADQEPDETVPGNIEITVTLDPSLRDDGPGDTISVASPRGEGLASE